MRLWSKLLVAWSSSSKLKILVLSAISLFEEINCWRSSPWFFLKNFCLNCLALLCLSLLVILATPRSERSRPKPALIAITVIKPAQNESKFYSSMCCVHWKKLNWKFETTQLYHDKVFLIIFIRPDILEIFVPDEISHGLLVYEAHIWCVYSFFLS